MAGAVRRVTVHLGLQKTGTTAFHHFIGKGRDALAGRLSFLLPDKGTPMRRLGRAAIAYSVTPDAAHRAALADAIAPIRDQLLALPDRLLLSHENLPGAMPGATPGTGAVAGLYPHLSDILDLLDAHLAPLRPDYVICLRDMAGWKASVWAQAVETDGYRGTLADFLDQTAAIDGWDGFCRAHADRVTFLPMDAAHPDRPGRPLLRHLGLTDAEVDALPPLRRRINARLNPGTLEFIRRVNGLELDRTARDGVAQLAARSDGLFAARLPAAGAP